jgi:hypothetical protein
MHTAAVRVHRKLPSVAAESQRGHGAAGIEAAAIARTRPAASNTGCGFGWSY